LRPSQIVRLQKGRWFLIRQQPVTTLGITPVNERLQIESGVRLSLPEGHRHGRERQA
jgi:hypothetical protein